MDMNTDKKRRMFSTSKRFLSMLRPFRLRIAVICICALLTSFFRTIDPLLRQRLIDNGVLGGNLRDVVIYALLIFSLFLFLQLSEAVQFLNYTYINKLLPFRLFHNAFRHLLKLPVSFFKESNSTKIINNVEYDVMNIAKISDPIFVISIVQGLCMIGGVAGLTIINWKLTVLVILVIPVKVLINNVFTKKRTKAFEAAMKLNTEFSEWIGETVQGITTIKLWGMYWRKIGEFTRLRRGIIRNGYNIAGNEHGNNVASSTIDALLSGILYILGAVFIFKGQLTLGGLFSFISYSSVVISSISFLTRIKFYFTPIIPSLKRYFEFMETEEEHKGYLDIPTGQMHFKFKNVSLSYDGDTNVLSGISFELRAGERTAIVGTNGSGKSSIIQLILRLYEPSEGIITYCGTDIRDLDIAEYRGLFSQVEQKVFLFNATVRENISLYQEVSEDRLIEAAKLLGVSEFLSDLPDGLDTAAGVDGAKLSGGERQKLAALRAWAKPHKILILDEATNNLDGESERLLNEFILQQRSNEITLIVTHRVDILHKMDKILVLDDGKLVGQGTYEELLNSCCSFVQLISKTGN